MNMDGLLDDLTEAELKDLIAFVRTVRRDDNDWLTARYLFLPDFSSMTDAEVLMRVMAGTLTSYDLSSCPVRKVLAWLVDIHGGWFMMHVPEGLRDHGLCLAAVRSYGRALEWVPMSLRDKEMCMEAVMRDGEALRHVPEALRDLEMCLAAVIPPCANAMEAVGIMWNVPEHLSSQVADAINDKAARTRARTPAP